MEYRVEHDTMGEVRVPTDALWRAQTPPALEKFPISRGRPPKAPIPTLAHIQAAPPRAHPPPGHGLPAPHPRSRRGVRCAPAAQQPAAPPRRGAPPPGTPVPPPPAPAPTPLPPHPPHPPPPPTAAPNRPTGRPSGCLRWG